LPNLFIFLDESGNFDFSAKGTRYFTITTLSTAQPDQMAPAIYQLKHQVILAGEPLEYFHASEDRQWVRDQVFEILAGGSFELDTVVVDKAKTRPSLRDEAHFYPRMCGYLLRYVLTRYEWRGFDGVVIFTAELRVKRKQQAIEKGLKEGLRAILGRSKRFWLLHHASKSHLYLQAVDYCNWAIYVKWERGELRPYQMIQGKVRSEFDIFAEGGTRYY